MLSSLQRKYVDIIKSKWHSLGSLDSVACTRHIASSGFGDRPFGLTSALFVWSLPAASLIWLGAVSQMDWRFTLKR